MKPTSREFKRVSGADHAAVIADDRTDLGGVALAGTVDLSDTEESRHLLVPATSSERLREELRIVKRRLLSINRDELKWRGNVFMVGSALPGDGKSFITYNLARSLSHDQDNKVILIDGDFKKPHLSRSFGVEGEPGFLDVLAGEVSLESVTYRTGDSNLMFIPAGRGNDRANERLASRTAQHLFETKFARSTGHIILFDSAPVLRASETQVLAQMVGQVALVVRAGKTPRKALAQALDILGTASNCAVILNDADVVPLSRYSAGSYGYGYGYGYGNG